MNKAAIVLLALGCLGATAVAAPMISVAEPEYSITPQTNSLVTHTFVLRNAGDETLTISRVGTPCGCTTAALATQALAPGQSVDLAATVNTRGFKGTETRLVRVYSNDPVTPVATLRIMVTMAEPSDIVVQEMVRAKLLDMLYLLIDVRTPDEYAVGHLCGAVNIPLAELQTNLSVWVPLLPRDVPIIFYDLAGEGSIAAATLLARAGLVNVFSLAGGLAEWQTEGSTRGLCAF